MNDEAFRRIALSATLMVSVVIWAFAIIGARSVLP